MKPSVHTKRPRALKDGGGCDDEQLVAGASEVSVDIWKFALMSIVIIISLIAVYNTIYYPLCAMYMGLGAIGAACYMMFLGRRDRNVILREEKVDPDFI